jgi:hypothetical protein
LHINNKYNLSINLLKHQCFPNFKILRSPILSEGIIWPSKCNVKINSRALSVGPIMKIINLGRINMHPKTLIAPLETSLNNIYQKIKLKKLNMSQDNNLQCLDLLLNIKDQEETAEKLLRHCKKSKVIKSQSQNQEPS